MVGQDAINDHLPAANGGSQPYLPSGKLRGKKALITGGDSGIGRAIAILYAMEGAESTIVYLPEEDQDAQETTRLVESRGGKLHLIQADLQGQKACADVVTKAKDLMGSINILVLNHGYQMMKEDISELDKSKGTMGQDIQYQRTPFLFPLKICAWLYVKRRRYPDVCFG
ncbi:NADP(+)-dependent dehydrogenase [Blumeria graminis f. sp. tritici 96224]|nr:NADP(+)-dependent dehydrogenase [Blumeria graminis f. sp. tritici 96224]